MIYQILGNIAANREKKYTKAQIEEFGRNARAYGWEVGRGAPIAKMLETTDGNPFMNPDWREENGLV